MSHASAILVVAALIRRSDDPERRILVVRRGPGKSGAGFWEFPGGKVDSGETPEQALTREIDEELSLSIKVESLLGENVFAYPAKTIRLRVYWAVAATGEIQLSEHDAAKWCRPAEIIESELSEADRPFVQMILQSCK
ncbi:MAG: (deoxy)nucleoside triphosphate pyrophosphohydrolase [Bdellovibrio sp.]|nr:(deoxy)nucleoside triphosphate pyrophosphohydrolase [Bdellovibrio sp.]